MKIHPIKNTQQGVTRTDVLLGFGIVFFLIVIYGLVTPASRSGNKARRLMCCNNLNRIGMGFSIFAADHQGLNPAQVSMTNGGSMEFIGQGFPTPHFRALASNEMFYPNNLLCPADNRVFSTNWTTIQATNISYFCSLDAGKKTPGSILVGDRNWEISESSQQPGEDVGAGIFSLYTNTLVSFSFKTIYKAIGNIGLGDGSVQQFTSSGLKQCVSRQELGTNRLAFP